MNTSAITNKIYSILGNQSESRFTESVHNYNGLRSEKISHDLLEEVWDCAHDGMLLTDSDGIITAVNTAFSDLVSMNERDLIGFPFTVIFDHTIDRKEIFDDYLKNIQQGAFIKKQDTVLQLNSGKYIDVEMLTSTLEDDAQEVFVLTEFRDISERKKWEQVLRKDENRYRSLFENSILPLYESNIDGKFINANVALLKLLGYETFEELRRLDLGKDVYANPEQRVKLFENLQRYENTKPNEIDLKKKDSSIISVLAHSRLVKDENNNVTGFEGALEDITERKMLEQKLLTNIQKLEITQEELTKLNSQKDKILAIVSHDLRSPFSSILGFCDLLKSDFSILSDSEKMEYIGFINDAAMQQLNLVNSILDWSRLETGRVHVKFVQLDLLKIVSETLTTLLGLAKKKNVELRSSVPENTFINADEQLLRQLLLNLVGNALKFTPSGGTISVNLMEDTNERLIIEISDTGMGIPASDLDKLFKMEEKYSRKGLEGEIGTGLGLPMCYEIMKKHNGLIEVKSEERKGTSFILTFEKRIQSSYKKVLIADDQKGNRLIISRFLKKIYEDCDPIFAETGTEALELLKSEMPNLIITDFHMPNMDGLEFIRKVREDEQMKNTPVILVSGDKMEHYGPSDSLTQVLQKPVSFGQLKGVLEKIQY